MSEAQLLEADDALYGVVVNHEGQYSIWPRDLPCPQGWQVQGGFQSKEECLAAIDEVWTDMRPISLRKDVGPIGPTEMD